MAQHNVPMWLVVYKVAADNPLQVKTNLSGPGHATDIAGQMTAAGYVEARATCGQLVIEIPDPVEEKPVNAEELPPAEEKAEPDDDKA